jgi:nucleotide-binding universal stress UspA family protein
MYTHILIPVDGSTTSSLAASRSLQLAARIGARVAFVNVPDATAYAEIARDKARAFSQALLEFWQGEARALNVASSIHLCDGGAVAEAIVERAQVLSCDAIFMGTHGRHNAPNAMLGSVAERVSRLSARPVLLLRNPSSAPEAWVVDPQTLQAQIPQWRTPDATPAFARILVAVDGAETGWRALEHAAGLASGLNAHLYALHVIESFASQGPARAKVANWDAVRHAVRREGRDVLADAQARCANVQVTPLLYEARGHSVGQAVTQAATETGADLIVVGTHNRSGISRWVLGSVSALVTGTTALPVLLVPNTAPPQHAAQPAQRLEASLEDAR